MKALELNNLLHSKGNDPNFMKHHDYVIHNVRAMTDTSAPKVLKELQERLAKKSPDKFNSKEHDRIAHENLKLAKRIFQIMDSHPKSSHLGEQSHPGTLNYQARLKEARRIHHDNMNLASRLESAKRVNMFGNTSKKSKSKGGQKPNGSGGSSPRSNPEHAGEIDGYLHDFHFEGGSVDAAGNNRNGHVTSSSASNSPRLSSQGGATESEGGGKGGANSAIRPAPPSTPQTARGKSRGGGGLSSRPTSKQQQKVLDNYVLLESRKIQGGRQIDVAVIKEPFKDKYAVFGIDIENGQRYERRLTSFDISGIVDGDMIVTSTESIEVWKNLLSKINLLAVDSFSKIPSVDEEHNEGQGEVKEEVDIAQPLHNNLNQQKDGNRHHPLEHRDTPRSSSSPLGFTKDASNAANEEQKQKQKQIESSPVASSNKTSSNNVPLKAVPEKTANVPTAPKGIRPSSKGGRAAKDVKSNDVSKQAANNSSSKFKPNNKNKSNANDDKSSSNRSNNNKDKDNNNNNHYLHEPVFQLNTTEAQALVKLQARFRGYKARKIGISEVRNGQNNQNHHHTNLSEYNKNEEKIIKLQARFRGFSIRMGGKKNTSDKVKPQYRKDSDNRNDSMITQPGHESKINSEHDKAAVVLQAKFRGFRVRKETKNGKL